MSGGLDSDTIVFPILTTEGGQCFAFPDVCKTSTPAGPVPIPYPNLANLKDGRGTKKVLVRGYAVLRKGDTIRRSVGDNAGTLGGVVSNKFMGKASLDMGWTSVRADGKAVGYVTIPTSQNTGSPFNMKGMEAQASNSATSVTQQVGSEPTPLDVIKDFVERCAPSLKDDIAALEKDRIPVSWESMRAHGYYDNLNRTLTMNRNLARSPAATAVILAHEATHAKRRARIRPMPNYELYMKKNLRQLMKEEAHAFMRQARVLMETAIRCGDEVENEFYRFPDAEDAAMHMQARKAFELIKNEKLTDPQRLKSLAGHVRQTYERSYTKMLQEWAPKMGVRGIPKG